MQDAGTTGRTGVARRRAFTILTILFGVAGAALFGVFGLIGGWFESGDRLPHRVHDITTGIVWGLLIAGAFLFQSARPERKIALMQQAGLAIAATLVAGLLSADSQVLAFLLTFGLPWAILLWLHPARGELLRPGTRISPALAGIAVAAAVPLIPFALRMAELQRNGIPTDEHVDERHWLTMAGLAFALILIGLLAAMRTSGWRWVARFAGLAAFLYGMASVVFPDSPGAEGVGWGVVAIAGGVLFVAVAEWEARRMAPWPAPRGGAA